MLRILSLISLITLFGCTAKIQPPSPQSSLEAVKQLCHAVGNHDYYRAWQLMPASWRKELSKAIKDNTELLPEPMLNKISKSVMLLADTAEKKSELLTDFIVGMKEDDISKEKINESFHSLSRILKTLAVEIAVLDKFNEEAFFTNTVTPIMKELENNYAANLEFEEENGYKLKQFFNELRNVKLNELKDGRIEFKICGELYQLSVEDVDGVFVAESLQEFYEETLEGLKEIKVELEDIKIYQIIPYTVAGFLEGVAVSIQNAEKPRDIEKAFNFFPFGLGFGGGAVDHNAIDREKKYQEAQAYILGQELAKSYKGKGKCLIIHNPVSKKQSGDLQRIGEALHEGLGEKVTEMRMLPIKDLKFDDKMAFEEAMMENTAEDFNKVINANKDCDLIICMVPLPSSKKELSKMTLLQISKVTFGVYNGYIGPLEEFFTKEKIQAMSLWRPDPTIDEEPVPESKQQAFDKRYLIVTPENLSEIKKKYPALFPKAFN